MKFNLKGLIIFLLIFGVVFISYIKLFSIFYQQDEWLSMGRSLLITNAAGVFQGKNVMQVFVGMGRFIPFYLGHIFFTKFPFNSLPFALFSLIFHAANAYITYRLALKLIKNNLFAVVVAMFFIVNSVASGAVSWYGTTLGTLPATTLVLFACWTFMRYLNEKKRKWNVYTFLLLYFSLFFKEIGIQLFIFFPLLSLIFEKKRLSVDTFKSIIFSYWPYFLFFLINSYYRIYDIRFIPQDSSNVFVSGPYYWQSVLLRGIIYPLTSFSQIFIHPDPFLNLARFVTRIYYPYVSAQEFPLIVQTIVADFISAFFSFVLFFLAVFTLKRLKDIERKFVIFWLVFSLVSYLPYIIISKNFSYLESRYYYLAACSMGIVFSFAVFQPYIRYKNILVKVFILFVIGIFLLWHFNLLQKDLAKQVVISKERVSFLSQLSKLAPNLKSNKTIFLINSDADYYMVGNKIPFQQGSGYTLMVWYFKDRVIPKELLKAGFLYDLTSQGYKEINGYGFGYYWDKQLLNKDILSDMFKREDVISFYYNSSTKTLTKEKL